MQGQACHPDLPTVEAHYAALGARINQSMAWMGGQSYKRTKIYGIYPDRSHFIPISITIIYALTTHCARACAYVRYIVYGPRGCGFELAGPTVPGTPQGLTPGCKTVKLACPGALPDPLGTDLPYIGQSGLVLMCPFLPHFQQTVCDLNLLGVLRLTYPPTLFL